MSDLLSRITQLSPQQREALLQKLANEGTLATYEEGNADSIINSYPESHDTFPLTEVQKIYWLGQNNLFNLSSSGSNVYSEFEFRGIENEIIEKFQVAINELIHKCELLRLKLLSDELQQVLKSVPEYQTKPIDLQKYNQTSKEAELVRSRNYLRYKKDEMGAWPLFDIKIFKIKAKVYIFQIRISALLVDGTSRRQLLLELFGSMFGSNPSLVSERLSFQVYAEAMYKIKSQSEYIEAREARVLSLSEYQISPVFPLVSQATPETPSNFVKKEVKLLSPSEWKNIKSSSITRGLTPSTVLLTAFAKVVSSWSESSPFLLALIGSYRHPIDSKVNTVIGNFNTVHLLPINSNNGSFRWQAQEVQDSLVIALDNRPVSDFEVLRRLNQLRGGNTGSSVPVLFNNLAGNRSINHENLIPASYELIEYETSIYLPQVLLLVSTYELQDNSLLCVRQAIEELFPTDLLDDMFSAYSGLLHRLATDEGFWEEDSYSPLPPRQLQARIDANETSAPLTNETLHNLFVSQVSKIGDKEALVTSDKKLTYRDLYYHAVTVQHKLNKLVKGHQVIVAIFMEKGWEQIVGAFGALFAGFIYLPLDPNLPKERLIKVLEHSGAKVILTQPRYQELLRDLTDIHITVVEDGELITDESLQIVHKPDDLAYVIYTSGSTGTPKGVMISHQGAVNTVLDINQRFGVTSQDKVLALSSLSFDLSVYDIFGVLAVGGTVILPQPDDARDPSSWLSAINEHGVTIWNSVPALMTLLVEHMGKSQKILPNSLRLVMLSGDWIPLNLPSQIKAHQPNIEVFSLGGATEASIWSIVYPVGDLDPTWKSIPYGKPMTNQTFHVLNSRLEPCPVWVSGDMYIGGLGLAKGYWKDPTRTQDAFIIHPKTGERLYKTGDLGRYLPDGNIEFLGRIDHQVKIRGFRIEPGEIEAALLEHDSVQEVVVLALGENFEDKRLVAYLVFRDDGQPTINELREHLKAKLPDYMVPAAFVFLDALPLTPNGKVDRKALPNLLLNRQVRNKLYYKEIQSEIKDMWKDILNVSYFDNHLTFAELGGDSISVVKLKTMLEDKYHYPLHWKAFRGEVTILSLAARVGRIGSVQ